MEYSMALIKVPTLPPQAQPVTENRGDGMLAILHSVYWLYLSAAQVAQTALAVAVDVIQRDIPNFVRGALTLLTVNQIPKVTAAGTLGDSALSDDGTLVGVAARYVRVDNNQSYASKDSAGADRGVLFLDATNPDVLHIRNNQRAAGGPIAFDTGAAAANTASIDGGGNYDTVAGVYQVAGTQVVGPRGAAITATAASGSAAGIAYLQATAATWVTVMNTNKTRIDELEARLQAHGLIT